MQPWFVVTLLSFVFVQAVKAERLATAAKQVDQSTLPKQAREILKELPDGQITLDFVLKRAAETSDSFRASSAYEESLEAAYHQSRIATDLQFYVKGYRSLDKTEPTSAFATTLTEINALELGVSRLFETGTQVSGSASQSRTKLGFPSLAPIDVRETVGTLSLTQHLLKDSFGYGTRRQKEAGEFSREAAKLELQESIENWSMDLIGAYYNAWLAQAGAIAARENVARRERLLNITNIKMRRGTSEEPDRLQVHSALLNAKVEREKREKILGDRWRSLVTTLKFPMSWAMIDATQIPLVLDDPSTSAFSTCTSSLAANQGPPDTATTEKLSAQAQAAELQAERSGNLMLPDLSVFGSLSANGVDADSRAESFSEMRTGKHPAFQIGLQLQHSLGQHAERAEAALNRANAERLSALASAAQSQLRTDWLNACADLKRLIESAKLSENAYESQLKRVRLEEERFRIGRTSTLGVIQSGDDAALAEIDFRTIEIEKRFASWKVFQLSNILREKLPGKAKQYFLE